MNIIQRIARKLIEGAFYFMVGLNEQFHNMKTYEKDMITLRKMPKGTLGNDIVRILDKHNLNILPNYESHDLKHVILGYDMTPEDEIRMQAFMLGNGNYTIPCFVILFLGILIPEKWSVLYQDFKLGRKSNSIANWQMNDLLFKETLVLRQQILGERVKK